jgi:hypothetical protein
MRLPGSLFAACVAACSASGQQSAFFSFEGSLQGWEPHGLDLQAGGAEETWTIASDRTVPFDGAYSARLFLDNENGAGKIWLERTFTLSSSGRHSVHVDFAVRGVRDGISTDRLIAGVLRAPPRSDDALPTVQAPGIAGASWTSRTYDLELDGSVATVVIGISGGSPGQIVYYLDAVTVAFADR